MTCLSERVQVRAMESNGGVDMIVDKRVLPIGVNLLNLLMVPIWRKREKKFHGYIKFKKEVYLMEFHAMISVMTCGDLFNTVQVHIVLLRLYSKKRCTRFRFLQNPLTLLQKNRVYEFMWSSLCYCTSERYDPAL